MLENFAKIIIVIGIGMIVFGILIFVIGKIIPIGKLPGDIIIQKENFTFYFPVVTMIIVSIILTLLLNLFRR